QRRMALLEQIGIFDPLMMQLLNRQSESLRAGANSHLLGAMRRIEERDRERLSQPPNEQIPNQIFLPTEPAFAKGGLLILHKQHTCRWTCCPRTGSPVCAPRSKPGTAGRFPCSETTSAILSQRQAPCVDVAGANSYQGELPCNANLRTSSSTFAAASAVAGFASETQVGRGFQEGGRRREGTARETRQERFMSLRVRPEISKSAA